LALREDHDPRAFENKVLKRIFLPQRGIEESWRKLSDGEFHNLHASQNIIGVNRSRRMKWETRAACMRQMMESYKILA
jgi:hypothetical protein